MARGQARGPHEGGGSGGVPPEREARRAHHEDGRGAPRDGGARTTGAIGELLRGASDEMHMFCHCDAATDCERFVRLKRVLSCVVFHAMFP
jgi:hypothetical protein